MTCTAPVTTADAARSSRPHLCGVWPGRRGLTGVLVHPDGRRLLSTLLASSEETCWGLLVQLDPTARLGLELVLPAWLARTSHGGLAQLALARGVHVWVASVELLEAIFLVSGISRGPAHRAAAALARLPLAPLLRGQLRRLEPPDHRQMILL
jgi:hypothetical protein